MPTTKTDRGWGFPRNSKKAHYFTEDGRSLCGKWGFYNAEKEDFNDESSDNCTACKKALLKIRAKAKVEELKETKKIEF